MKKSMYLVVMFALFLTGNVFANHFVYLDTLAKNSKISKEVAKKPEAVLSAEEISFQEEINAYYTKKYSNPLKVVQSKLEKIVVVDMEGKVILEENLTDHKVHEAHLPVGAEKLMEQGTTAYYVVTK